MNTPTTGKMMSDAPIVDEGFHPERLTPERYDQWQEALTARLIALHESHGRREYLRLTADPAFEAADPELRLVCLLLMAILHPTLGRFPGYDAREYMRTQNTGTAAYRAMLRNERLLLRMLSRSVIASGAFPWSLAEENGTVERH